MRSPAVHYEHRTLEVVFVDAKLGEDDGTCENCGVD